MSNLDWNCIKSVNGQGKFIPIKINLLISGNEEEMRKSGTFIEQESIHAGLLYEASFYTIDLVIDALIKTTPYSKWHALELLMQLCLSSNYKEDSDIEIENQDGNIDVINITLACRRKIKNYLEVIKSIEVNDARSQESKDDVIETIEEWDENFSSKPLSQELLDDIERAATPHFFGQKWDEVKKKWVW